MTCMRTFSYSSLLFFCCLQAANGFTAETVSYLNGHTYVVTVSQPFFRVEHKPHTPIPGFFREQSMYNKSMVPDDDVYIAHNWTETEKKYMDCTTLTCVCPFYNGSVVEGVCVLPNGKELTKAIRKDYRQLTDDERHQMEIAFNLMYADGVYHRFGRVHKYGGTHSGPAFYTWHREFMKRFEFVLRTYLPMGSSLGVPYWDSTTDGMLPNINESIFFTELLAGDVNEQGEHVRGAYANWETMDGNKTNFRELGKDKAGELLNDARIDVIMDQAETESVLAPTLPLDSCSLLATVTLDDRMLEYSHDYVHYYIGGDFAPTHTSTNDIIFYWHHSFIDSIWEMWRQKQQTRKQRETAYPRSDRNCFPEVHFKNAQMREMETKRNKDALSNDYTDFLFEYAPRPKCSLTDTDGCQSKFFFCDTTSSVLRCSSKVRMNGNCTGYEGFNSCYEGKCLRGRCMPLSTPDEPTVTRDSTDFHSRPTFIVRDPMDTDFHSKLAGIQTYFLSFIVVLFSVYRY